ncbi:hypothetical protein CXG81DRAFT_10017, partial [Caulochytrium protostelioides]
MGKYVFAVTRQQPLDEDDLWSASDSESADAAAATAAGDDSDEEIIDNDDESVVDTDVEEDAEEDAAVVAPEGAATFADDDFDLPSELEDEDDEAGDDDEARPKASASGFLSAEDGEAEYDSPAQAVESDSDSEAAEAEAAEEDSEQEDSEQEDSEQEDSEQEEASEEEDSDDEEEEEQTAAKNMLSDSDDGSVTDSDADSDADLLPIEKDAKALDEQIAQEEQEDAADIQTNIASFPALQEQDDIAAGKLTGDSIFGARDRIQEVLRILNNFKTLRDPKIDRCDYVARLHADLKAVYNYNDFLLELLAHLFNEQELVAFLEASDSPRPMVIRTNTLKTRRKDLAQALVDRGVNCENVPWNKVALQIFDSPVPIGATPEYLAGHYILQGASSMLPVMALAPQEGERVLDMAAAPGGKTTHIGALLKNSGMVVANDVNAARCRSLMANVHRLGVRNCVVTNVEGQAIPRMLGGFDRVLLDAPCSGTGVISKDPTVKMSRDAINIAHTSHMQRQLLLAAIDAVDAHSKTGGVIVYSTCSVATEENERVVEYALTMRPNVRLVETGLEFGTPGFTRFRGRQFSDSMKLTRRFYPHVHNMDGFYVAKFRKVSNVVP